jgi:hypothetical protein
MAEGGNTKLTLDSRSIESAWIFFVSCVLLAQRDLSSGTEGSIPSFQTQSILRFLSLIWNAFLRNSREFP